MKLRVNHDRLGNITAIVASPDSPVGACTVLQPRQRVTEIEVPEIAADLGPKQILERLSGLMQTHRVELKGADGPPHAQNLPAAAKPASRRRSS